MMRCPCGSSLSVENCDRHKEPTPTPSITVGTQVRLTGTVHDIGGKALKGKAQVIIDGLTMSASGSPWIDTEALEVIRQPFKRGEVVYIKIAATNETPFVVLNDENLGFVDVTNCATGFHIPNDNAEAYERRPSRPKEER